MARRFYALGRATGRATPSALEAPPPRSGEVRRTALPDTFDGIRFEIGRMIRYVMAARKDPVMIKQMREICEARLGKIAQEASMNGHEYPGEIERTLCVEAIDQWCREHFVYVNDPPNIEVIQTPSRMVKQTKIPRAVIKEIIAPFYEEFERAEFRSEYEPPAIYIGDCDEGSTCMLGLCACVPIPEIGLRYRFGGNEGTLHHVWAYVGADGKFYDCDHTEPGYKMGDYSRFEAYEEAEVPA